MRRFVVGSVCGVVAVGGLVAAASPATARPAAAAAAGGAGTFVSLGPSRLLDTRVHTGGVTPGAHGTVHLQVTGHGGVPSSGVSAVVLTVTAVAPSASGFVTVYADGGARPATSNLNFTKGRTVPNLAVAPVNRTTGKVALYNGSGRATPLLADVSGYYVAGTPTLAGSFRSLTPARILDTRTHRGGSTPKTHSTVSVQVTGKGGVPASGVAAVIMNVTAVAPSGGGYLTIYGSGQSRPTTSSTHFGRGETVSSLVEVAVGSGGKVSMYNGGAGSTPLVADVAGYVRSGTASAPGTFKVVSPQRVLDTRRTVGASRPGPRGVTFVELASLVGGNVSAVVMTVTVPDAAADGHVTVGRGGDDGDFEPPNVSNLNFRRGQTVSNLVFAPLNRRQVVFLYSGSTGSNDLLGDITGYYIGIRGSISGTVTDASTGAPIRGVQVSADAGESGFGGNATTDANGRYEIDDLYPMFREFESYQVCFASDTGTNGSAGGYLSDCLANGVQVQAGETTSGVNDTLTPGVAISGSVTAGSADPSQVSFHTVAIFDSTGERVDSATGQDGRYRVAGMPAGTYTVCSLGAYLASDPHVTFAPQCYVGKAWDGTSDPPTGTTPVSLSGGGVRTGVDFRLTSAG